MDAQTLIYSYRCRYTGLVFRCKVENVASVKEEPYPPGGTLLVCYNAKGQAIAGPLASEIIKWEIV